MSYRELRRRLEQLGCIFERQGGGSHEIWLNPRKRQADYHPQAQQP